MASKPTPTVAQLQRLARTYARRAGIDPEVFVRQISDESGWRTNVTSSAGAEGIAQFMPGTAKSNNVNPWDPRSALRGAANLDATLIKQTGSYRKALAAYNAGPGNIPAGYGYADKILNGQTPSSGLMGGGPGSSFPTSSGSGVDLSALRDYLLTQNRVSDPTGSGFLGAIQAVQAAKTPAARSSSSTGGTTGGASFSTGLSPLGKAGKVIGGPFQGTHAKAFNVQGGSDNWQSENAIDIAVPKGTPVYAVADGVLGNTGSLGQGGRFAGLRTNLIGKGNSWYYAHLSKLVVKAGEQVRKGQLLGYSGEANGVAHLHFASEKGNPQSYDR